MYSCVGQYKLIILHVCVCVYVCRYVAIQSENVAMNIYVCNHYFGNIILRNQS